MTFILLVSFNFILLILLNNIIVDNTVNEQVQVCNENLKN